MVASQQVKDRTGDMTKVAISHLQLAFIQDLEDMQLICAVGEIK